MLLSFLLLLDPSYKVISILRNTVTYYHCCVQLCKFTFMDGSWKNIFICIIVYCSRSNSSLDTLSFLEQYKTFSSQQNFLLILLHLMSLFPHKLQTTCLLLVVRLMNMKLIDKKGSSTSYINVDVSTP